MRIVFGIMSLLVVLAIVGSLAKRQLQAVHVPAVGEAGASGALLQGTPALQSQQLQQNIAEDVNQLMKQAPSRVDSAAQ